MEQIVAVSELWPGLAAVSAILARHLRISIALFESCFGVKQ